MNNAIFRDVSEKQQLRADFLLRLFFDPEDGGNIFLENFG
jgi:hypothetical protein